jgi:hypothetical protein
LCGQVVKNSEKSVLFGRAFTIDIK